MPESYRVSVRGKVPEGIFAKIAAVHAAAIVASFSQVDGKVSTARLAKAVSLAPRSFNGIDSSDEKQKDGPSSASKKTRKTQSHT